MRSLALTALAGVIVVGRITDQTTGQPLASVTVRATGPSGRPVTARTGDDGRYQLTGLRPGRTAIAISSNDVPPQRFSVTLGSAATRRLDLTACSTTLDYSCASPPAPGSSGPGGGG